MSSTSRSLSGSPQADRVSAASGAAARYPETLLPDPSPRLVDAFRVAATRMDGLAFVNPALIVEAVGFAPWQGHWLGVLVTPWFMNLVLMPREPAAWHAIAAGETRHHVFPAGVFEFIGSRDAALGDYQACSLFSPMFEFADHAGARATALAALEALFDSQQRDAAEVRSVAPQPARTVSKRGFLFGTPPRGERGP